MPCKRWCNPARLHASAAAPSLRMCRVLAGWVASSLRFSGAHRASKCLHQPQQESQWPPFWTPGQERSSVPTWRRVVAPTCGLRTKVDPAKAEAVFTRPCRWWLVGGQVTMAEVAAVLEAVGFDKEQTAAMLVDAAAPSRSIHRMRRGRKNHCCTWLLARQPGAHSQRPCNRASPSQALQRPGLRPVRALPASSTPGARRLAEPGGS
jgi:hypothetical protein